MARYESTEIRRRQIAEAALAAIAEDGLPGFTSRAVAARLEIADGTIFRHFANKTEIVIAAMDRLEEELFVEPSPATDDPLEQLEHLFRSRAHLVGGSNAVGRLVFSHDLLHAGGAAAVRKFATWRDRTFEFVSLRLQALRDGGRLRTDIEIAQLVHVFVGSILVFSNERSVFDGVHPDLDAEVDRVWGTLEQLLF